MQRDKNRFERWLDKGYLTVIAVVLGVIAGLMGGTIEDLLSWIFVGVPLLLFVIFGTAQLLRRRTATRPDAGNSGANTTSRGGTAVKAKRGERN